MYLQHFVRFGTLGHVGRFTSVDGTRYPRASRVVCRTVRGLEVGEILSTVEPPDADADGQVLRAITVQDDLLLSRLEKNRQSAFQACEAMLSEHSSGTQLMEVEHLFDGQSLFFYFLGNVPDELETLTGKLAEAYEAVVQFRKFTTTLLEGCGPGCGTEDAEGNGCGSGGCASCLVAQSCGSRKHTG